jgi:hypothetical protein
LQFVGERQGSALGLAAARSRRGSGCHRHPFTTASPLRYPLKPFLKEGFKNPKNFKKIIYQCFLKVLGSPETLFQKGFWWGAGATPLPCKPKFENSRKKRRLPGEPPCGLIQP